MISIGGIIGAGLFVGSSAPIAAVGPAVVVSYLIAGLLILLVMRMLAEMACALPGARTFTEFARAGLGPGSGLHGRLALLVFLGDRRSGRGHRRSAATACLDQLVPALAFGVALIAVMTGVNLMSARSYGEFEFWFASIKVAAIIVFIALAAAAAAGLLAPAASTCARTCSLTAGFMPHGLLAVLAGVTSVFFSLTGAEITTVAAAESKDPARALTRMTTSVITRILLFYVASVALIVMVVPWDRIVPAAVAVHARVTRDALSVGGHRDERGHPHRGAVLPELAPSM